MGLVTSRVGDVSLTNSEMTCAPSVLFGVTERPLDLSARDPGDAGHLGVGSAVADSTRLS